jgi:hypothetical protein
MKEFRRYVAMTVLKQQVDKEAPLPGGPEPGGPQPFACSRATARRPFPVRHRASFTSSYAAAVEGAARLL